MPTPPHPQTILRPHSHPLHALAFSPTQPLLYSGDESGVICITDLRARRCVASWKGHEEGALGVGEWEGGLVSHGRDNLLHFHHPLSLTSPSPSTSTSTSSPSTNNPNPNPNPNQPTTLTPLLPPPTIRASLDVNSLNFCAFGLIELPDGESLTLREGEGEGLEVRVNELEGEEVEGKETGMGMGLGLGEGLGLGKEGKEGKEGLIVVPNLTDSESVDIYHLPTLSRLHAAVTHLEVVKSDKKTRGGLVMGVDLHFVPLPTGSPSNGTVDGMTTTFAAHQAVSEEEEEGDCGASGWALRLIVAFEDGRLESWINLSWKRPSDSRLNIGPGRKGNGKGKEKRREGDAEGWVCEWSEKGHNEAIMGMTVSPKKDYAFTVSADHFLIRYKLEPLREGEERTTRHPTKQIGNSAVKVSPDGRVVAVAGWDGSIRLFSVKSFKGLGTLSYHREACHAVAFPPPRSNSRSDAGAGKRSNTENDVQDIDDNNDDDDDEEGLVGGKPLKGWESLLAGGGKDRRISVWELMNFGKKGKK